MGKGVACWFVIIILVLSCMMVIPVWASVDLVEDTWTRKASMDVERSGLGAVAVNGKIYAIGGTTASGNVPCAPGGMVIMDRSIGGIVDTNEVYDPATNKWEFRADMPTPRMLFATTVYQNKIYCIGGRTRSGDTYDTNVNEVYDPSTDRWETRAPMPTNRCAMTAEVVNGKIYVIGGYTNRTLNQVYDPETDNWTTKASSPKPTTFVDGCASAVVGNKIHVIGGISEGQSFTLHQIYDPETDDWRKGGHSPL